MAIEQALKKAAANEESTQVTSSGEEHANAFTGAFSTTEQNEKQAYLRNSAYGGHSSFLITPYNKEFLASLAQAGSELHTELQKKKLRDRDWKEFIALMTLWNKALRQRALEILIEIKNSLSERRAELTAAKAHLKELEELYAVDQTKKPFLSLRREKIKKYEDVIDKYEENALDPMMETLADPDQTLTDETLVNITEQHSSFFRKLTSGIARVGKRIVTRKPKTANNENKAGIAAATIFEQSAEEEIPEFGTPEDNEPEELEETLESLSDYELDEREPE